MNNALTIKIINISLFALVILVNTLANVLPINGMNTGQISDLYPSLFTPTGFTFAVWSLLYLLQLGFVVVQFWLTEKSYFRNLSRWFWLACVANSLWIFLWHYLVTLGSVLVMCVLLFSLIKIFLLMQEHSLKSWIEKLFVRLTFTFYLSWICVATIANMAAFLIDHSWSGGIFPPQTWTVIMIGIAASLGIYIALKWKEPFFLPILIWAFFGIYRKWVGTENGQIALTAAFCGLLLVLIFSLSRVRIFNPTSNKSTNK